MAVFETNFHFTVRDTIQGVIIIKKFDDGVKNIWTNFVRCSLYELLLPV